MILLTCVDLFVADEMYTRGRVCTGVIPFLMNGCFLTLFGSLLAVDVDCVSRVQHLYLHI
jgi:hypothetical protein